MTLCPRMTGDGLSLTSLAISGSELKSQSRKTISGGFFIFLKTGYAMRRTKSPEFAALSKLKYSPDSSGKSSNVLR